MPSSTVPGPLALLARLGFVGIRAAALLGRLDVLVRIAIAHEILLSGT